MLWWLTCPSVNRALVFVVFLSLESPSFAQTSVQDIFGRLLNQHGITLVDWDGYLANPLLKFYILPPTNGVLPGTATLTADGERLYFDTNSTVSVAGPSKTISLTNASTGVPVRLSIFPDRDSLDENYTLMIVFTGANAAKQTNTVPIHVIDQDLQRTNDFVVIENFDRDITGVFTNPVRRAIIKQAADDWAYFFAGMNLDAVHTGTETTYIWSNNFAGGYYFSNTNAYTGYLLYAYGTTNSVHRSGGEASYTGPVQSNGVTPLKIKRSGGHESEIYGNYNTLGWLYLTNDSDWLVTGNLGNETNDLYSIAHHEIGHALIFNEAHPGFNFARTNNGAFTSAAVTNYYGGPVLIDSTTDHLTNALDPESLQGAFGHEYYGAIPRKRWIITKLDLLCAQEVGYTLRTSSAFAPLTLLTLDPPPGGTVGVPYTNAFVASGGIPFYEWDIVAGALPTGLALGPFTGVLSGIPTTNGAFTFTLRVRDYHEAATGITRSFPLTISAPPPPQLSLVLAGQGINAQAQLSLFGTLGQQQIVQASSNLSNWTPIATNSTSTSFFQVIETNALQFPQRFYRAVVVQ